MGVDISTVGLIASGVGLNISIGLASVVSIKRSLMFK